MQNVIHHQLSTQNNPFIHIELMRTQKCSTLSLSLFIANLHGSKNVGLEQTAETCRLLDFFRISLGFLLDYFGIPF